MEYLQYVGPALLQVFSITNMLIILGGLILGVIIGIPLFGFMGIIFGPLLISIFILFLKIYRIEYFSAK